MGTRTSSTLAAFDARRALVLAALCYAAAALALVAWYGNRVVFVDEAEYYATAANVVELGMYSRDGDAPDALRPPGYAAALLPFAAVDAPVAAVRAVQLALLAIIVVVLARVAGVPSLCVDAGPARADVLRDWRGVVMLALLATNPVLPFTANLLFPQTVMAAVFVGTLAWILVPERRHGTRSAIGTGLACGYAVLLSPTALSFAPVAAWALARRSRMPLLSFLLVLAATLVPPAAWTARNRVVLSEWIPVSSNLSANLGYAWADGPNDARESAQTRPAAPNAPAAPDEASEPVVPGEPARPTPFADGPLAVAIGLASAPGAYFLRVAQFFASDNRLQTEGQMSHTRVIVLALSYYSLLALLVLRLALARRFPLDTAERIAYALYAITALFHALVFARVRYRLPFDVIMLLPAANALLIAFGAALARRRTDAPGAASEAASKG